VQGLHQTRIVLKLLNLARQEHLMNMVKYGTRDDLVWTCMFDKFDSGTLLYTSLHLAYLSLKVRVTVQECHSATVLSPTRVGLLRHVADKAVPAAASVSPSPFVSFDWRVINLYQPTRLQDITDDYFWCTSGCPDGSWQTSHSLLSGNGCRRRQVEVTLNDLMQLTRQARAAPCSNRALGWHNGPSPSISSVD
jgi:hypothetical protein